MIAFRKRFFAALAVATGAACSAGSGPEAGVSLPTEARGRVRVAVVYDQSAGTESMFLDGRIWLLRSHDLDAEVADILAGVGANVVPARGQCALVDSERELDDALATTPSHAQVEHLDGGEVLIHAGDSVAGTVAPRDLPALFPYATGVQYGELLISEGLEQGFPDGGEISVTAFGGDDVGPFHVSTRAPKLPGAAAVSRTDGLVVEWEAADEDGARSEIEAALRTSERVEVVVTSELGGPVLRCLVEDSGRYTVSSDLLAELAGAEVVAIERSRRVSFRAAGLRRGTLEVVARHVVTEATR